MEERDYVSFDTALALKKAGFNYSCRYYYTKEDAPDMCVWRTTSEYNQTNYNNEVYGKYILCSAPTLWQAQKWLREAKNMECLCGNAHADTDGKYQRLVTNRQEEPLY